MKYDALLSRSILLEAVQQSKSYSQCMQILQAQITGIRPGGGLRKAIYAKCIEFHIDTSHFTGQLWSKGEHSGTDPRIKSKYKITVLKKNSPIASKLLRTLIIQNQLLEYKCSFCGISEWQNRPLCLHIDHIDGDWANNEIHNLRWLCPNCHSQTPTFGAKNKNRREEYFVGDDTLIAAIKESTTIRKTLLKVGLVPKAANYHRVYNVMATHGLVFQKPS